ncbi:MAG: hypothetical protein QOJ06_37 [Pseudonocardiales bacterium]|nr:hypothetical protein [Pseudonocardiales bacterium]
MPSVCSASTPAGSAAPHSTARGRIGPPTYNARGTVTCRLHNGSTSRTTTSLGRLSITPTVPAAGWRSMMNTTVWTYGVERGLKKETR